MHDPDFYGPADFQQVVQNMWRLAQFRHDVAHCRAVIVDMMADDNLFLCQMVDAVRCLFDSHGALELGRQKSKSQERMERCVCDCHRFAEYPSKQKQSKVEVFFGCARRSRKTCLQKGGAFRRVREEHRAPGAHWHELAETVAFPHPCAPFHHVQLEHFPSKFVWEEVHVIVMGTWLLKLSDFFDFLIIHTFLCF